jgi:hypothetical protein
VTPEELVAAAHDVIAQSREGLPVGVLADLDRTAARCRDEGMDGAETLEAALYALDALYTLRDLDLGDHGPEIEQMSLVAHVGALLVLG